MRLRHRVIDGGVDLKLLDGERHVSDGGGATNERARKLEDVTVCEENAAADAARGDFHESQAEQLKPATSAAPAIALQQHNLVLGCERVPGQMLGKLPTESMQMVVATDMIDTLDSEDVPDEGGEAPNGGETSVQLVSGMPVAASTKIAKPSTSMIRKRS